MIDVFSLEEINYVLDFFIVMLIKNKKEIDKLSFF